MIVLSNVCKTFDSAQGRVIAVDDVNLAVEAGQIYGIIGYSGAGKSTLIRLLNGLETPTSGSIQVDGFDIAAAKSDQLRQARLKISMVFQHFNLLWSRTVSQNIAFSMQIAGVPKAQIKPRVAELVALVGLQGREEAYPSQLSGGQKQRVGIARALANNPGVLLCDEATSALDPQTTDSILDLLLDINRKLNLTIVLITHEMHVVRKICHRVAVMENGRIVEEGPVIDVFTRPQQPITQQFVKQVSQYQETEKSFNPLLAQHLPGAIFKLTFVGVQTHQAVISDVILRYKVSINILHGKITQTLNGSFGELYIHADGNDLQIDSMLKSLKEQQIAAEVIKHD
ncbi:Methionine import ATP-binding protein MetN [Serratia proteamaculans]|jgi:D-methionine transport system ATP-binding protein|uniref:Methionine ABC transporter ATP-binding protein n=1 Tax=Serratia proteamaculans TaxID=28151 RepID=A0ABS0TKQ3_SERPR|nr:methionine ABC transporter ATP-binding protein [Serratia proteamaculans]SPZ56837.1 Methionine import ATP-binding protein MetN [Serratia quinivorans]MBI6178936.1 methionine ABC transporter ATP-binding protein [Serratia proteamaculans]RYM51648.1 methionine ABC transporter ATP-binding protein [Serratia proteamaculans]RYM54178.1 methionine ABC transporter ATP-binding protein [Serratia proteamaculans]CAI0774487.1 Methionine import ATP-binding protein MetN [Serratia proteamaculans]